jgi:hypothetical protein
MNRSHKLFARLSLIIVALLAVGCAPDFVSSAARASLASFITDVVSSGVNATINP